MKWAILALLLLLPTIVSAQEQPVVSVDVSAPEVTLGESVEVRITVLVPTWFPKPPVFPSLELANAITRLPPDSSYPTSERIGRDTWSGIVRNYRVYPLTAATYRLSDLTMTVTYANPGADAVVADIAVPEIVVRGVVPAGAEELEPYIAGNSLALTREIDGDMENLEAGDALVVRYVAELDGLPAIFLPPISHLAETPGLSIYADEPIVEDGDVARRSEQITLVFEAGGEFSLPGAALDWWNLDEQSIERASVPGVSFTVAGPLPASAGEQQEPVHWRFVLSAAIAAAIFLILVLRFGRRVSRWQRRRAEIARQSEAFAFEQLRRSTDDARAFYAGINGWLGRLVPDCGARQFAVRTGDSDLSRLIDQLARSLYASEQRDVDLKELLKLLTVARREYLATQKRRPGDPIPRLNPGSLR